MKHASMAVERKLDLIWVEAAHLENDFEKMELSSQLVLEPGACYILFKMTYDMPCLHLSHFLFQN